ncbi:MAG: hydroxymethylglutaryl-CoA lyase [Saprospiraceae bacterium]|nr:hydroxymethylglutaryl-CoA lyase [Saprospiraceae bacterium]MCB9328496.1 hydroxymethylglutaryl-CoA lyase [Lewinellaceae bacterium]
MVKIIEASRDAMQGLHEFIPTKLKAEYINQLLKVGFDTLDFGSFVSPKAIPQLSDTSDVLSMLDLSSTKTKLLAIVANKRGAIQAAEHQEIKYLGYPFSISETFQIRNTNATIEESITRVADIIDICHSSDKEPVIYISMGFGNPYGDEWNAEICMRYIDILVSMGVNIIALSDTIGVATTDSIEYLFESIIPCYPTVEIGAHLHSRYQDAYDKVSAAIEAGCRRIDCAIRGFGGCPMAKDDLTGNMPTEVVLKYLKDQSISTNINWEEFKKSMELSSLVF